MQATRIVVEIPGEKDYNVRVGADQLECLADKLDDVDAVANCPHFLIITDSTVEPLYASFVKRSFERAHKKADLISVPAGEDSKSIEVAGEIWRAMADLQMGRDSAVVALGGGVVGDLAGFVASTYMRGVSVVQVPTTLLSMVDSSVGGKTAINLPEGKNLVGTFMQPVYVCASVDTLSTLNDREWRCGCAEVVKSAAIDSDDFFFWMMENADALAARDLSVVTEAVKRCVVFKAGVVAEDKTESKGVRECLNYGHTLAHAIEVLSGYGTYSHGAAVAEGMRFAAFLGERVIATQRDFIEAQASLLDALSLDALDWSADPEEIVDCMKRDKKARDGHLRFVLLEDVGAWSCVEVEDDVVLSALKDYFDMKRMAQDLD